MFVTWQVCGLDHGLQLLHYREGGLGGRGRGREREGGREGGREGRRRQGYLTFANTGRSFICDLGQGEKGRAK